MHLSLRAQMLLDIHALVQNTHDQNTRITGIVENDVFLVMVGAQGRLKGRAQPAERRIVGQHLKAAPQGVVVGFRLRGAEPGLGVIEKSVEIGGSLPLKLDASHPS